MPAIWTVEQANKNDMQATIPITEDIVTKRLMVAILILLALVTIFPYKKSQSYSINIIHILIDDKIVSDSNI